MTSEEAKLKEQIVRWAMRRLISWKLEHPEGLTNQSPDSRKMIEACLKLEALRKSNRKP